MHRELTAHGTGTRYNKGCRCPDCTEHNRKRHAALRTRPMPEAVAHGKPATYRNWGCRCPACKEAGRADNKRQHIERTTGLRPLPDRVVHGKLSTYNNWGCRCPACKSAASLYYRRAAA